MFSPISKLIMCGIVASMCVLSLRATDSGTYAHAIEVSLHKFEPSIHGFVAEQVGHAYGAPSPSPTTGRPSSTSPQNPQSSPDALGDEIKNFIESAAPRKYESTIIGWLFVISLLLAL
jgi:hypothetical protein